MEVLRSGGALAEKSLLLSYSSLPPQLVLFRALRSRDGLIAVLSLTAVLANVLTVALSGLLSQQDVFIGKNFTFQPLFAPRFGAQNVTKLPADILSMYNQNDPYYIASANFSNQTSLASWTGTHFSFLPLEPVEAIPNNGISILALQTTGYGADLQCQHLSTEPSNAFYEMEFNADGSRALVFTHHTQSNGSVYSCKGTAAQVGPLPNSPFGNFLPLEGDPEGQNAFEIAETALPISNISTSAEATFCGNLIAKGWVRTNFSFTGIDNSSAPDINSQAPTPLSVSNAASLRATFMSCHPRLKSAPFNLTISSTGSILTSTQIQPATYDLPSDVDLEFVLSNTITAISTVDYVFYHNDTLASDWTSYLIRTLANSPALLDPSLPPPDYSAAAALLSEVFSRLFAIQLTLHRGSLAPAPPSTPAVIGQLLTLQRRVFLSRPLYLVALSILVLDFCVAVAFYASRPAPFLPRLPTSIASQIAYLAGSSLMDELKSAGGDWDAMRRRGYRYGYGKFVGKDGWAHVGIEREPFVVKLDCGHQGWWWRKWWKRGKSH
jgi:hypothetical protein